MEARGREAGVQSRKEPERRAPATPVSPGHTQVTWEEEGRRARSRASPRTLGSAAATRRLYGSPPANRRDSTPAHHRPPSQRRKPRLRRIKSHPVFRSGPSGHPSLLGARPVTPAPRGLLRRLRQCGQYFLPGWGVSPGSLGTGCLLWRSLQLSATTTAP